MEMEMKIGMWRLAVFLLGVFCFADFCHPERAPNYSFLHQATSAPEASYYDYIIVGGGTAGCPLAATLSQNFTVLLLERGGSPYDNPNITDLVSFANILGDTSPSSAAQRFISEDGVVNSRARILGGGSCINAGFYTHASDDYVRKAGWNSKLVEESYRWVEKGVAQEPRVLQWQSALRDGLLEVDVAPSNGFTYEHIYGTKVGGTIFDEEGHRHTAADLLQYANVKLLTVYLQATVQSILFQYTGNSKPAAEGVVFKDVKGAKHRAYLNKGPGSEIILAAGAIGSPQLLMLSGVGAAEELRSLGIDVVSDQPMVGQGMSDNPMNVVFIPSPSPVEVSLVQVVGITHLGVYIEGTSGVNIGSYVSNISTQTSRRVLTSTANDAETTNSLPKASFRGGFILEKIAEPKSTGHMKLKNRNPEDNPAVTFNYFKEPEDLQKCMEGMALIQKVVDSKAFSMFRYPNVSVQQLLNLTASYPVNLRPRHANDSTSLEQYCKDTVVTIWHYHGGCQVGRVVDRDYRVLGVEALRVVDGSTFSSSPGTNPQATVMMLGRYVGIKVLEERLGGKWRYSE